jgi:hypothetical protein
VLDVGPSTRTQARYVMMNALVHIAAAEHTSSLAIETLGSHLFEFGSQSNRGVLLKCRQL